MCEKCLQSKKDKEDDLISQFTDQIQTALITNRQVHAVLYHPNLGFCHKKSLSRRVNDIPNDKHTFSEKKDEPRPVNYALLCVLDFLV